MYTRIKICCISSIGEAELAIAEGADALGLVGKMPSGPGPIPDELIAAIAKVIRPPVASFLLTSAQKSSLIIEHVRRTQTTTVQIVDELIEGNYDDIRKAIPHVQIVQVIHVQGAASIAKAVHVQTHVDAILLDSGNPDAAIKTLGGTGNTHDWAVSKELVQAVRVPVYLAGGLHAGNVKKAVETVQPFGVDVCSGVRTNGLLDQMKLFEFIRAVKS
jgi:phosphoribosylanthranilate isomerase